MNLRFKFALVILAFALCFSFASAANSASFVNYQAQADFQTYYTASDVNTYWPILGGDEGDCKARQDILLSVAPGGCQPMTVRSDLLADQNVAVFCQINALQINPLIDIKQIKNIRFSGKYPDSVVTTGFHPARAALRTRDMLLGSPLINNIGYVVVVLKRNPVEKNLSDFVSVNLSASLEYDAGNALGIGRSEFVLGLPGDEEQANIEKLKNSFWNGRYSLILNQVDENYADVSIYDGDRKISDVKLKKGELSREIYLPGSYCMVALQLSYDGFVASKNRARIEVTNEKGTDSFDVSEGSTFLNGKCSVGKIDVKGAGTTAATATTAAAQQIGDQVYDAAVGKIGMYEAEQLANRAAAAYTTSGIEAVRKIVAGTAAEKVVTGTAPATTTTAGEEGNVTINCGLGKSFVLNVKPSIAIGAEVLVKTDNDWANAQEGIVKNILSDGKVAVTIGTEVKEFTLDQLRAKNFKDSALTLAGGEAFNAVITAYENVADNYPAEQKNVVGDTYGEEALVKAIAFADKNGQYSVKERLLNKIIALYPNSGNVESYRAEVSELRALDLSSASATVDADGRQNMIRVKSFYSPTKKPSAILYLGNQEIPLKEGEKTTSYPIITLNKVLPGEASVSVVCAPKGTAQTYPSLKIADAGQAVCSGSILKLNSVDVDKAAKVRVLPVAKGTQTQTNLSVTIGIEKRGIQLSPTRTKERIKNINESIDKWEKISKNLGKVVKGLKNACLATSAILTVKNFMSGVSGESLARQQAMSGPTGWTERCKNAINDNWIDRGDGVKVPVTYRTASQCYNGESDFINKEIRARTAAMQTVNAGIASVESKPGVTTSSFATGSSVNEIAARDNYLAYLKTKYAGDKVKLDYLNTLKVNDDKSAAFTYHDLRDLEYNWELGNIGGAGKNVEDIKKSINDKQTILNDIKAQSLVVNVNPTPVGYGGKAEVAKGQVLDIKVSEGTQTIGGKKLTGSLPAEANAVMYVAATPRSTTTGIAEATKQFIVVGKRSGTSGFTPLGVYSYSGDGGITLLQQEYDSNKISEFTGKYAISGFEDSGGPVEGHPFKTASAVVRYFGTGPDKGLASIVPFDLQQGWYVKVDSSLKVGNNIGSYDASGLPKSWNICNVGDDGTIGADDKCTYYVPGVDNVLGLPATRSKTLIENSRSAIRDANNQASGTGTITILGQRMQRGAAISALAGTSCEQFMDIGDCNLLFNLCDPVICPPSRCNFGGDYPVADVIQSGIVGSALLCLPNFGNPFEGGVAIPVCLSGLQAGLDGWVSILKAHRDCLQENLESGEMTGICDQLYSIYWCDFFWRQIGPALNTLIPKMVEKIYSGGQSARGGGEYLTVQAAWDNAEKSVDYITGTYAVNAFKAFQVKSVTEIGAEICKAQVSAKGPTALESLTELESPPQFHAWFSSVRFNDATLPATAQYKVFYHIFAGNNAGVYYSVYLKSPPDSPYYSQTDVIPVDSGFIGKGESADETKDFTAPEGYKELCVRINNEEECGFSQVSSSYAINTLRDSYVAGQATEKGITSQSACVSGTASVGALLANANPQAALEESALPQISNRGIVRICSSINPGASTDPGRYSNVGYCDSEQMICWLDSQSVENAITENNVGLKNATLLEIRQNLNEQASQNIPGIEDITARLKALREKVDDPKLTAEGAQMLLNGDVKILESEFGQSLAMNNQKAQLMLLEARLVEKANIDKIVKGAAAPPETPTTPAAPAAPGAAQPTATQPPVLSLAENYDPGEIVEVLLENNRIGIYLLNNKVMRDTFWGSVNNNWDEQIGTIKDNKITLLPAQKNSVNSIQAGLFDYLDGATIDGKIILSKSQAEAAAGAAAPISIEDIAEISFYGPEYMQGIPIYSAGAKAYEGKGADKLYLTKNDLLSENTRLEVLHNMPCFGMAFSFLGTTNQKVTYQKLSPEKLPNYLLTTFNFKKDGFSEKNKELIIQCLYESSPGRLSESAPMSIPIEIWEIAPTTPAAGEKPRIIYKIWLYFNYGDNDLVKIWWNFDTNMAQAEVTPNEGDIFWTVTKQNFDEFSQTQEVKDQMYPQDINYVKHLLNANSPSDLSLRIQTILKSGRVSIDNNGQYNVDIKEINKLLYGSETAPAAGAQLVTPVATPAPSATAAPTPTPATAPAATGAGTPQSKLNLQSSITFEFRAFKTMQNPDDIYYRFNTNINAWQWSQQASLGEWKQMYDSSTSQGVRLNSANIDFNNQLLPKNFASGVQLLILRTKRNNEGYSGVSVYDAVLIVHIIDKSKTYSYNDNTLDTIAAAASYNQAEECLVDLVVNNKDDHCKQS